MTKIGKRQFSKEKVIKEPHGITEMKLTMKLSTRSCKERICEIEDRPCEISLSKQRMEE